MTAQVSTSTNVLKPTVRSRRSFVKAATLLVGGVSLVQAQNAEAVNAAVVNRSARMRALSQRLVKLKAQQLLQINLDATSDTIVVTEKLISSHLQFLSSSVPSAFRAKVDTLAKNTAALLAQAKLQPTTESLKEANVLSLVVLKTADELTKEMQALAKVKAVEVVNIAGRQRMLSQRMTKNYLLFAAKADTKEVANLIAEDRKLFSDALKQLAESSIADGKIKQELTSLGTRFKKFDELLADLDKSANKAHLANVATISEQVLSGAHDVTMMFEDALKAKEVSA
jgi:Type IV pili methyl-accepting chemotaxis transducer N-term